MRLFCFPHAGGTAALFRGWAKALPSGVEVCAMERPLEPTKLGFEAHVAELARELAPAADRPYALLGHSMGGLIAFELARTLRARGVQSPRVLIVSGCRAPSLLPARTNTHTLSDAALTELLVVLGGTPSELLEDPELRPIILGAVRRDYALLESYVYEPGPPLDVPIMILRGARDPETTDERIASWSERTGHGSPRVATFDGGHFFPAEDRAAVLRALAEVLDACMSRS